jgi:hypothetical protein
MPEFSYVDPFPIASDDPTYRRLSSDDVSLAMFDGHEVLKVAPQTSGGDPRRPRRE